MTTFNNIDILQFSLDDDLPVWIASPDDYSIRELNNGDMELHTNELDAVEEWASDNGLIDSEQALSDQFDELINDVGMIFQKGTQDIDKPAMREWFNNWTDGLRSDGELHETQCNEYCYVGAWDNEIN